MVTQTKSLKLKLSEQIFNWLLMTIKPGIVHLLHEENLFCLLHILTNLILSILISPGRHTAILVHHFLCAPFLQHGFWDVLEPAILTWASWSKVWSRELLQSFPPTLILSKIVCATSAYIVVWMDANSWQSNHISLENLCTAPYLCTAINMPPLVLMYHPGKK